MIAVAAAILVVGAGAAVAILLTGNGGRPSTTADTHSSADTTTGANPIAAGRYVQAGSFQTVAHAGTEQRRLAAAGIDVEVVSAGDAQQLYPGFQVLVAGPIESRAEEAATLRALHRNGVPSAFAQRLTPADEEVDPGSITGSWRGPLERTSGEHPGNDGALPVAMTIAEGGSSGVIAVNGAGCRAQLSLASSGPVVSYVEEPPCTGVESVWVRPTGEGLMVTLLSPETDSFALGTLSGG